MVNNVTNIIKTKDYLSLKQLNTNGMLPLEIHDLDWDSTKHDGIKPFMEYQPSSF